MLDTKKKNLLGLIVLAVLLLLTAGLILWHAIRRPPVADSIPTVTPRPTAMVVIQEREVEKLVEIEKEITAEEIESGLVDMGVLVTEEYYFTDVLHYSSIKSLFHLEIGITESSYLASYDGVVTAGVDFSRIRAVKDDEAETITVTLPKANILNVDIDPESFQLYSEKSGLGNPVSVEDFNASLVELERSARERALDRGLLDRADENARKLIRTFITGLLGPSYSIRFVPVV